MATHADIWGSIPRDFFEIFFDNDDNGTEIHTEIVKWGVAPNHRLGPLKISQAKYVWPQVLNLVQ